MKKNITLILLTILIAWIIPAAIPTIARNNNTHVLLDAIDTSQTAEIPAVAAKITQDDPRGHLTGRIFFNGFDDIEPDGYRERCPDSSRRYPHRLICDARQGHLRRPDKGCARLSPEAGCEGLP